MRRTFILILALGVAGCSGSAERGSGIDRLPVATFGVRHFLSDLKHNGVTPRLSPRTFNAAFPGADEYRICIDGTRIRAYEYASERERVSVSKSIDATGSQVGPRVVEWIGTPRFYGRGRLLVLTLNTAKATNKLFARTLGPTLTPHARSGRGVADVDACVRPDS